jgi:hypothetical protein
MTVATMLTMAAATAVAADDAAATSRPSPDTFPHPVLPEASRWPTYTFRTIGAMFVLAAVVGPILRKRFPKDLPPTTHSHDEPPGTSGHHGRSGTKDLHPPEHPHH